MCKTRILSCVGQTIVSQCVDCKEMSLWHNNLLLNFSVDDFLDFQQIINGQSFFDCCITFPDGEDRIIIRTPDTAICFTFCEEELELFRDAIAEALHMASIYALFK